MSSDPAEHSSVVRPGQLATIQKVFDDLVREAWFQDSAQNRDELAAMVMHAFRGGKTDEFELLEACRERALERFNRP